MRYIKKQPGTRKLSLAKQTLRYISGDRLHQVVGGRPTNDGFCSADASQQGQCSELHCDTNACSNACSQPCSHPC
jgi:hypothetical protein